MSAIDHDQPNPSRLREGHVAICLLGFCFACAAPGPMDVARAYGEALRRKDAEAIRALTSEPARAPEGELARQLDERGEAAERTALRFTSETPREVHTVRLEYEGATMTLVREPDGWRVLEGGWPLARTDSPIGALRTLFLAVDSGRPHLAAAVIPSRFRASLPTAEALAEHLENMKPRIARARELLGDPDAARVEVRGTEARLPYGRGLAVIFVLEEGEWRILDLE